MSNNDMAIHAETAERLVQRTAVLTSVVALLFISDNIQELIDPTIAAYLKMIDKFAAIGILIAGLNIVYTSVKLVKVCGLRGADPEGFVAENFKKACVKSFAITVLTTTLMDLIPKTFWEDYTGEFLLNIVRAVLFASFSISFLIFNRSDTEEDDDFEQMAGGNKDA